MNTNKNTERSREQTIIRTSVIGIIANLLLSAFKAAVGLLSHSVAVVLDAVNNLSDALSSIITIIGMMLAGRPADKKHPFGYGRIEYITSMFIASIILAAGFSSFVESIKKVIHPETATFTNTSLIIIASAIFVKLALGFYFRKMGKKVNSDSLTASGTDALGDSLISVATLVAAGLNLFLKINVDGILSAVISVIIIKSGIEIMLESVSHVVGERADNTMAKEIKKAICAYEPIHGAFDLVLHSYGPDNYLGSIHIEVDDTITAGEIHRLTNQIQKEIEQRFGVFLTIGIYAVNTKDDEAATIQHSILKILSSKDGILQSHGWNVNTQRKTISFDIVVDFKISDAKALREEILQEIRNAYPEYTLSIQMDRDYSD